MSNTKIKHLNSSAYPLPDISAELSAIAMKDMKVKPKTHDSLLLSQEGSQRMARKVTVRFDKVDNLRWLRLYNK
jgi:hypothetical protein